MCEAITTPEVNVVDLSSLGLEILNQEKLKNSWRVGFSYKGITSAVVGKDVTDILTELIKRMIDISKRTWNDYGMDILGDGLRDNCKFRISKMKDLGE